MTRKYNPTENNIIIKETTIKGAGKFLLFLVPNSEVYEVVSLGPDVNYSLKVGDKILTSKLYTPNRFCDSGVVYFVINEEQVLAIIED